jgi:hypothetical protein
MLSLTHKILKGLSPAADRFAGNTSTSLYSMRNFERLTFVIFHAPGDPATGTTRILARHVSNAAGDNFVNFPFRYRRMTTGASDVQGEPIYVTDAAAGILTIAGEDTIIEVELDARDLPNDRHLVRLAFNEVVDAPIFGSVTVIGHGPTDVGTRYSETQQPSHRA